jgi:uncharacterized membrane protein YkvA (DUF1232 family)
VEWWEWVVLGVAIAIPLTVAALWLVRRTRRGRAIMALSTREKMRFGRLLVADPGISTVSKVVLVALLFYLAMPFDLIPDFIPVLGQLDDLVVLVLAIALLMTIVPGERLDAAIAAAREPAEPAQEPKRRRQLLGR